MRAKEGARRSGLSVVLTVCALRRGMVRDTFTAPPAALSANRLGMGDVALAIHLAGSPGLPCLCLGGPQLLCRLAPSRPDDGLLACRHTAERAATPTPKRDPNQDSGEDACTRESSAAHCRRHLAIARLVCLSKKTLEQVFLVDLSHRVARQRCVQHAPRTRHLAVRACAR